MVVVDISDGDMTPPKKPMFADYKPYHAAATDVSDDDVEIIVPKPNIKYMGVSVRVKFRGTLHRFTHWEVRTLFKFKMQLYQVVQHLLRYYNIISGYKTFACRLMKS